MDFPESTITPPVIEVPVIEEPVEEEPEPTTEAKGPPVAAQAIDDMILVNYNSIEKVTLAFIDSVLASDP